jgi:phenolic acid decarboxylase
MKIINQVIVILGLLTAFNAVATTNPQCTDVAVEQAKKLGKFHGVDLAFDSNVKELPAISNPAYKKQKFQVLELWGWQYKGKYRIRLIYFHIKAECLLMGQEILEYAKP